MMRFAWGFNSKCSATNLPWGGPSFFVVCQASKTPASDSMVANMKLDIPAAIMFLTCVAASAQSPLPQLRIEPIGGGSIFYVKNLSTQPLTAYLIELVDYPGSSYSLWQDEIGASPIAPGNEKRIQVGNMTVGAVPDYVKVQAAVYADGSTAGVPEKITQLIEQRRETLKRVRETIERLHGGTPKEELIAGMKHAGGGKVFADTVAHLEKQSVAETVDWLRAWENALVSTKPAL